MIPALTHRQADAAVLVKAIYILGRLHRSWWVRWYLRRLALRLAR